MGALKDSLAKPLPAPKAQGPRIKPKSHRWTDAAYASDLWPASLEAAQKRLQHFVTNNLKTYTEERDYPNQRGPAAYRPI